MSAQVTTNGNGHPSAVTTWTEAPASATLRVVTPTGYEVLLTTRAGRMADLLTQLTTLEAWLSDHQWTPAPTGKGTQGKAQAQQGDAAQEDAPVCAIHGKPMTRRSKDGRSWWSCSEKLSDGTWCPYRPKGGA